MDDGIYEMTLEQVEEFLEQAGVDPAEVAELTKESELYEVTLRTEGDHRQFSIRSLANLPTVEFAEMISIHAAIVQARQLAFGDYLGERSWSVNVREGTINFGPEHKFQIQILGTESDVSGTWLWAWANQGSNLPESTLRLVTALNSWGAEQGIEELVRPQFDLQHWDGHHLALAACGWAGKTCYYRCPYENGAMFVILADPPEEIFFPTAPERLMSLFTSVLSSYYIQDHQLMAESFLLNEGFTVEKNVSDWRCSAPDGRNIELKFDDQGRLAEWNSLLKAMD